MNTDTLRAMAKLMERESDEPDDIRGLRAKAVNWAADEIQRLRATLLNIQALAERGFPIDNAKLAERCRYSLGAEPDVQKEVHRMVAEQAEDKGLWFQAQTCAEAYVQTALRKLHAAVEGDKSVIFPAVAVTQE